MQSGTTASGTDGVLHHAPEAFERIEVVPTRGREGMQVVIYKECALAMAHPQPIENQ
jgi:hypothetical protein